MMRRSIDTLATKRPLEVTAFPANALPAVILARADLTTYDLLSPTQARQLAHALTEAAELLEPLGGVLPPVVPAVERRAELVACTEPPRDDGVMFRVIDSGPREPAAAPPADGYHSREVA